MPASSQSFTVISEQEGLTLAALLRSRLPGLSWSEVRRLAGSRQVKIGGDLCLDSARRVHAGETIEILARPAPKPLEAESIKIRHLDDHVVVVEKPAGMSTVRHPVERAWSERRKALSPTLEDLLPGAIARQEGRARKGPLPRLRVVHRLDKETSGLVVFARTVTAERALGKQFHRHTALRRYLAVVGGTVAAQTIRSHLVRDRGDRRRGSTSVGGIGKEAVTHVEVVERMAGYTLLSCRLETGRTHQIRIHLAELGHPICGESVYHRRADGSVIREDRSVAPRLALHALELGFVHPVSGTAVHWEMPLPEDLEAFLNRLRSHSPKRSAKATKHDRDQVDRP